jgi:hypothetical protein
MTRQQGIFMATGCPTIPASHLHNWLDCYLADFAHHAPHSPPTVAGPQNVHDWMPHYVSVCVCVCVSWITSWIERRLLYAPVVAVAEGKDEVGEDVDE